MKSLDQWFDKLSGYEFVGYKERQNHIANNFMLAQPGSLIMREYFRRICEILRSRQRLHWTTLGSTTLTATVEDMQAPWLQVGYELVQPVCWSRPNDFFAIRSEQEHADVFNQRSFCYMLSNNMIQDFSKRHPECSLLSPRTFFRFLYDRAMTGLPAARPLDDLNKKTCWQIMPFCARVLKLLAPFRVLDTLIGFGSLGMLVREICENQCGRQHRETWQTWVEGIASSPSMVEEYHHHFYDWIHVAPHSITSRLEGIWLFCTATPT